MPDKLRVAALQMNCRLGDKVANITRAETLLAEVSGRADIACLPEFFNVGYDLDALKDQGISDLAEPVPASSGDPAGPTVTRLCELAADLDLAVVAGLIERNVNNAGVLHDTVVLVNRRGQVLGRYRKSHLYPSEHEHFRRGEELPVFELDGLRVGVVICYEAAFPPICSTLALGGAQVIFNPSAVPTGYGYLQDVRTRARAQDNQIFVVAVNHVGTEGGVTYCGRSQVADPRGEVLAMAPEDRPGALSTELHLDLTLDQRLQEPVLREFRPELYRFQKPQTRHHEPGDGAI